MGTSTTVWIVAIIVVAAAVGGAGFFAGYEYRGSASSSSAAANNTLSILGAGTLNTVFPELASELVNQTPGISSPTSAQLYEGSLDITTAITGLTATADVAAVADYRLIPTLLEPKFASFEAVWGSTQEALVWSPTNSVVDSAFAGINNTNWPTELASAITGNGKPMGVWNASTDPNGYNEIFDMMLQGMIYDGGDVSAVYGQYYTGAPGALAVPIPSMAILEHESGAALDLSSNVVTAVITYRAFAILNHLPYFAFNPIVGLTANNSTALADYAKLSTSVIGSSGALAKVYPAPVLFAVTVPSNAQNPALGAAFIHLLLSPAGAAIIAQGGAFVPIFPGWSDDPSAAPPILQPDLVPLPVWAATILG
ncbi:MAG: substrate-binding domain-containing protein [Thermoplasmata archaeon]